MFNIPSEEGQKYLLACLCLGTGLYVIDIFSVTQTPILNIDIVTVGLFVQTP